MTFTSLIGLYRAAQATFGSPWILPLVPLCIATLSGSRTSGRSRLALAGLGFALGLSPATSVFSASRVSTPASAAECSLSGAKSCAFSARDQPLDLVDSVPLGRAHLVELISAHCTACAKTAPLLAELERECTRGDGTIIRVDVETPSGEALAQRFGVHAVPTFLQLDEHGVELQRQIGEQSRSELTLALENVRGEACPVL